MVQYKPDRALVQLSGELIAAEAVQLLDVLPLQPERGALRAAPELVMTAEYAVTEILGCDDPDRVRRCAGGRARVGRRHLQYVRAAR